MSRILDTKLDLDEFLSTVAGSAKQLAPDELEARVYEVDFVENRLYLKTSTKVDVAKLPREELVYTIKPKTITGDAIIQNRVIIARKVEGYAHSRFREGEDVRAAFPIEFHDPSMPEGRTKYVLVVDKEGIGPFQADILAALRDYSILAGLAISIKELRDRLNQYYEVNRNMILTGRHTAAIAHDIRSLNVGVGGFLNLALRSLENDSVEDGHKTARKHLGLAIDHAGQMEALLRNVAEFARDEVVLDRTTDLAEAVRWKIDSLRNRDDYGRYIGFKLSMPEGDSGFRVDRDWFGTVIENLVKNSFEAKTGWTNISVSLKMNPEKVSLTFEDDSGGIPAEVLPEIFIPFRSGKKKGQGLGLANAKKVVEDHGGSITVTNRPGHGAIFIIEFPLNSDDK